MTRIAAKWFLDFGGLISQFTEEQFFREDLILQLEVKIAKQ